MVLHLKIRGGILTDLKKQRGKKEEAGQ